jgi:hypothetical protein
MLFTHFGLSGPVVLSLSKQVVDALHSGRRVHISIDLKPALSEEKLDARLLRELEIHSKRQVHTMLKELLPAKLIPVCLELTGLPGDKPVHQLTALNAAPAPMAQGFPPGGQRPPFLCPGHHYRRRRGPAPGRPAQHGIPPGQGLVFCGRAAGSGCRYWRLQLASSLLHRLVGWKVSRAGLYLASRAA